MNRGIKLLSNHTIEDITLFGRLPELSIRLSGGKWIQSFMTADGQPDWWVFLTDESWLHVKRGCVFREHPKKRGRKNARHDASLP